jgi:hypothetical protein
MTSAFRKFLVLAAALISPQLIHAQLVKETTVVEPGVIKLGDLFQMADTVALVKITSGDTESYATPVYKAEVVTSFKGAAVGGNIYFGPYIGGKLGTEYLLFLRSVAKPLIPRTTSNFSYGTVQYSEVFDEGYSSMEISYECTFDGKEIARKCDYGVRVCTDYILLPKSLPTFPPMTEETDFGCRWVRKDTFIAVLGTLRKSMK